MKKSPRDRVKKKSPSGTRTNRNKGVGKYLRPFEKRTYRKRNKRTRRTGGTRGTRGIRGTRRIKGGGIAKKFIAVLANGIIEELQKVGLLQGIDRSQILLAVQNAVNATDADKIEDIITFERIGRTAASQTGAINFPISIIMRDESDMYKIYTYIASYTYLQTHFQKMKPIEEFMDESKTVAALTALVTEVEGVGKKVLKKTKNDISAIRAFQALEAIISHLPKFLAMSATTATVTELSSEVAGTLRSLFSLDSTLHNLLKTKGCTNWDSIRTRIKDGTLKDMNARSRVAIIQFLNQWEQAEDSVDTRDLTVWPPDTSSTETPFTKQIDLLRNVIDLASELIEYILMNFMPQLNPAGAAAAETKDVICPEDKSAGETITVEVDGRELEVEVPQGTSAGETFAITVPPPATLIEEVGQALSGLDEASIEVLNKRGLTNWKSIHDAILEDGLRAITFVEIEKLLEPLNVWAADEDDVEETTLAMIMERAEAADAAAAPGVTIQIRDLAENYNTKFSNVFGLYEFNNHLRCLAAFILFLSAQLPGTYGRPKHVPELTGEGVGADVVAMVRNAADVLAGTADGDVLNEMTTKKTALINYFGQTPEPQPMMMGPPA